MPSKETIKRDKGNKVQQTTRYNIASLFKMVLPIILI